MLGRKPLKLAERRQACDHLINDGRTATSLKCCLTQGEGRKKCLGQKLAKFAVRRTVNLCQITGAIEQGLRISKLRNFDGIGTQIKRELDLHHFNRPCRQGDSRYSKSPKPTQRSEQATKAGALIHSAI